MFNMVARTVRPQLVQKAQLAQRLAPTLARGLRSPLKGARAFNSYQQPYSPPRRSRWPWVIVGALAIGGYGYWKWLTHHNYPETVAELLRKALKAEISGNGPKKPNNREALKYYLEALEEADRLGMSPWSDEYTGIMIKVAESYEFLNKTSESLAVYQELVYNYIAGLQTRQIPAENRDSAIKKLLSISIIISMYVNEDPHTALKLLLPPMAVAMTEVASRSPAVAKLIEKGHDSTFNDSIAGNNIKYNFTSEDEAAYGSFKDELFSVREMFSGLTLATGQEFEAGRFKEITTQLMMTAGYSVGDILMSINNMASISLMHSSLFSVASPDTLKFVTRTQSNAAAAIEERPSGLPLSIQDLRQKETEALDNALSIYTNVVKTVESLPVLTRRSGMVQQAYAMAIYGQGLVDVRKGEWSAALERLREARIRARGLQVEPLLNSVTDELAKLEKLQGSDLRPEEIRPCELPRIEVMYWKLEPHDRPQKS